MRCSGMIAPGSGSGAPGTGQRAESVAVSGKGFFLGFTGAASFAAAALAESVVSESSGAESVTTESVVSGGTAGRGAWIARGTQPGGSCSAACLAPTGAFPQPSNTADMRAGKAEDQNLPGEV